MTDLLIHQTFVCQMLEKSQFAKLTRYTVPHLVTSLTGDLYHDQSIDLIAEQGDILISKNQVLKHYTMYIVCVTIQH